MPSLRGASFPRPDFVSALLLVASTALAQGEPRSTSGRQATSAASEERPRVILLVRTENDDGVMNRVRAELRAGAWRILELRLDDRLSRVPLSKLAAEQAVRAAVRFDPSEARIELWIFRAAGNVDETLADSGEHDDDAVLSLRITEALRARGLNLGPEPEPERGSASEGEQATPPTPAEEPVRKAVPVKQRVQTRSAAETRTTVTEAPFRKGLWLELAPALSGSPGGLGPAVAGWASVRLDLTQRWSWSLFGLVPVMPQRLNGPEGTAKVSTYFVGTSADAAWLRTLHWRLAVGAGVGWAQSEMRGSASSGYVSGDDSVTAITPVARATARLQLGGRWWVSVGGLGGVALPEVSVKFGERVAGRWGRPLLLATFGLELLAARLPAAARGAGSP